MARRTATTRTGGRALSEIALLSLIGLGLVASAVVPALVDDRPANEDAATAYVVVRAGDTLSSLAQRHAPQGWTPARTRVELDRLNDLGAEQLMVGQRLVVPSTAERLLVAGRGPDGR